MVSSTQGLPSRRTPLVDRFRNITDAWWPWMEAILKTVRATEGRVTEIIDQQAGIWGIQVNNDERVVGSITLDGSQSQSTFAVLADKFIIVHPAANATTLQAFIVGLVDGVSTVGINGNLFVDGTILARSLSVSELSAITANIGDVTAGVVRSADNKFVIDLDNKTIEITA